MKKRMYSFAVFVTILLSSVVTIQAQTDVTQWGFLGGRQGNWIFTPGSAPGGASIGGTASLSVEWGAIRGGFTAPVTATTSQAILVTGNIEFVGAGIDTWSGLRYGLFMHDSAGTLITTNVDSTRWSGREDNSHGYMFTPVSGTQRVTDGVSGGVGTNWVRISGNYISTSSGSGPVYLAGYNPQKPARAVANAGKYAFAFSVQPLANGTKEVRFYLIKGDAANSATSTYYFGGSYIDTSSIAPTFNGVVFAAHAAGSGANPDLRGVKLTDVKVDLGTPFTLPEAPWAAYYVDQWGFLGGRQGNWSFKPGDVIGNAGIGGDASLTVEWGAIRGGFVEPVTATTSKAILVTGNIEFEGAGIDTWSGLRYGLFMHDSAGTIITKVDTVGGIIIDSTRWSGREDRAHGYMFTPVSGTQRVTDGVSGGVGTNWVRISGNYISTSSGSGPVYLAGYNPQKPARAVANAGKYAFAFSVQPLANGTKEVRFYLIKGDAANSATSTYYFGGSYIDTSSIAPTFNGVVFAAHAGGSGANPDLRGVKLTDVKVDLGTPFTLPEAPWAAYYVDQWGFLGGRQGNWSFKPGDVIGNAGIGVNATSSVEWAAIRGGFVEPVTATTSKAILVTGNIEFEGAGIDTWSGLRYGLFMHDSAGTIITKVDTVGGIIIDSTRWSGREDRAHGYMFTPVSGTQRVTDGVSGGVGTNWVRISGNYISTSSGSGPVYLAGNTVQQPVRAVADAGKYAFAFSVQPLANGTKEVRFYLIKGDAANSATSTYYFGGSYIDTSSIAPTFNGVVFAAHAGGSGANPDLRGVKLTDVKVDLGTPFDLPEAPWADYYTNIEDWGVIGNRTGGWKFIPGDVTGNAGIGGTAPNTEMAAIRGTLGATLTPPLGKTLRVTGKVVLEGGGFEGANSLRFGIFYSDSAGTVQKPGIDSAYWSGTENYHSGYLFIPRSGTNAIPTWTGGGTGNFGAVNKATWWGTDGPYNYLLGSDFQSPANAVANAGTYNFKIELQVQANGSNWIAYKLYKDDLSYYMAGVYGDGTNPIVTSKFNSIAFALANWTGSTTTAMKVVDVHVERGTAFEIPVELTSFAASANGLDVTLNWATATELNNHGFEIQRKAQTGDFATVAFIKGHGTSTEKNEYSFADKNLDEGKYSYRLKQMDFDGQFKYSNTIEIEVTQLYKYALEQNYPNPFNPVTTIGYVLPEKSKAQIILMNALGQEVAMLVNEEQDRGYHKIAVDGSNLASGVYFYKLIAKDFVSVKKLILMK